MDQQEKINQQESVIQPDAPAQKMTLKRVVMILTGLLFAAYSAYNLFIILRDSSRGLSGEAIFITALVAALFAVMALYAFTADVKAKERDAQLDTGFVLTDAMESRNFLFLAIRRWTWIVAMSAITALKLRMIGRVIDYLDVSLPQTVWYAAAYFMTLAGMLIMVVYYLFVRGGVFFFPKLSVILPVTAMALFLLSLIAEAVMFFVYGIGLEANTLRTLVIRPVFYLGMMGLCAIYLFRPPVPPELAPPEEESAEDAEEKIMGIW